MRCVTEEDMEEIRIVQRGHDVVIFTYTGIRDNEKGSTLGDRLVCEFNRPVVVEDHSGEEPHRDGYVTPEHRYTGLVRILQGR